MRWAVVSWHVRTLRAKKIELTSFLMLSQKKSLKFLRIVSYLQFLPSSTTAFENETHKKTKIHKIMIMIDKSLVFFLLFIHFSVFCIHLAYTSHWTYNSLFGTFICLVKIFFIHFSNFAPMLSSFQHKVLYFIIIIFIIHNKKVFLFHFFVCLCHSLPFVIRSFIWYPSIMNDGQQSRMAYTKKKRYEERKIVAKLKWLSCISRVSMLELKWKQTSNL